MSLGREFLHSQLVKLGDMMGDGLHHEPDGEWISEEYRKICVALGYTKPKKRDIFAVNEKMAERVKAVSCKKCGGELSQTRSGSMRAKCKNCGSKFQLLRRSKQ